MRKQVVCFAAELASEKKDLAKKNMCMNCLSSVAFVLLSAIQFYVCSTHSSPLTKRSSDRFVQ